MAKITVSKTVYWNDGWKEASGKVKQILQDHALVETPRGQYLVAMSQLSLKPKEKTASAAKMVIVAASTKPPFDFAAYDAKAARMTTEELQHAIRDIQATIKTFGPGHPNEGWYADEMHTYIKELNKRKGLA